MTPNSKNTLLTMILLAALACGAGVLLVKIQDRQPAVPLSGPEQFVQDCNIPGHADKRCTTLAEIKAAFGFDLMAEIDARYKKMKQTAADIAAGNLTDEAYAVCLKARTCDAVPMLDEKDPQDTPRAGEISRAFWALAEGKGLTLGVCGFIPVCATALANNALTSHKNKIVPAKGKKS